MLGGMDVLGDGLGEMRQPSLRANRYAEKGRYVTNAIPSELAEMRSRDSLLAVEI